VALAKVLLIDDDEVERHTLATLLGGRGLHLTVAASASEAQAHIATMNYDVVLSDVHVPGLADHGVVLSTSRRVSPKAIALLLSSYPDIEAAADVVLMIADAIVLNPSGMAEVVVKVRTQLASRKSRPRVIESVATILTRSVPWIIDEWFRRVELEPDLMAIPLSRELRCDHLASFFRALIYRLRASKDTDTLAQKSATACQYGLTRRKLGYSPAMMVDESRLLEVSIYQKLQNNQATVDYSLMIQSVTTIADEIDSQLKQAMVSYTEQSRLDGQPC
jgi:DNA-binding response OmpR family regulator